ncbi:MAG: hypothetical protein P9F19_17135 [Candidatus Contendobacter sp.]|nr:hypothetical protein [Candidatus Contendobacter sp.]MDG4559092.1 hypothetical protein [Candidatus Contendobacter sp.]
MRENATAFIPFNNRSFINPHRFPWHWAWRMKGVLLVSMLVVLACCGSESEQSSKAVAANEQPSVLLESVRIGNRSVQFYIDLGVDSAVLGFSVENDAGQRRYFPLFGSTYRGIPSVALDVFVSNSQEEMWVLSSWPGYEILAYHRMDTDQCITRYGEINSFDKPMPKILGGGTGVKLFPEMDVKKLSKVATFKYDGKSPNGANIR